MKIKYIIGIICFLALVIFWIFVINVKNVDFESVVDNSLNAYYITGDPSELDEILNFLDDYSFHDETVEEVQRYINKKVNSWYEFLDNKFICSIDNDLACNRFLDEFSILNSKLVVLYEKTSEKGLKLMIRGDYEIIYDQALKKVNSIRLLLEYIQAKKDINHLSNCAIAICDSLCNNGICKCTYTDEYLNVKDIYCKSK